MGVRSIHDELNYFQHSQPSTPILSQKEPISRLHHQATMVAPPPVNFSRHPAASFSLKPKATPMNSISSNNNGQHSSSPNSVFTTTSSSNGLTSQHIVNGPSSLGIFNNSPHGRRPTLLNNKHGGGSGSNYYAATDIFHHVTPPSSDKYFERF